MLVCFELFFLFFSTFSVFFFFLEKRNGCLHCKQALCTQLRSYARESAQTFCRAFREPLARTNSENIFFYTSDRGSTALRSKQDSYAKCSPHKRNREQHLEIIHDDKLISPNNNSILFVCVTFLVTAPLACKVQRSLLDGDAFRFSQNPFKQPIKWFVSAHSICECSHP